MLTLLLAILGSFAVLFGGIYAGWLALGRPVDHRPTRDIWIAAWIGWYLQGMTVLALGWLGLLSPLWLTLLVMIPLGGALVQRRQLSCWLVGALRDYRQVLQGPSWAWLLVAGLGFWVALQLSAPPFHYDLLTYGFGQPLHWLGEGGIGPVGPDMYAYEAVPSRMHFLLSLGLFGAPMAGFSLLLWACVSALLVARVVDQLREGEGPWPLLAAAAFLATPAIWDLLLLRKDDLSAVWGGAALLLLHLGLRHAKRLDAVDMIAISLAAAATLAAKPAVTGGYTIALVAVTWWQASPARRSVNGTAIFSAVFVALVPIAIHTWLGLGHPLASVMPHLSRYDVASTRWFAALADAYPWQPQPLDRLLPYAMLEFSRFFNPNRWNFGDNLGLFILLGLPAALLATKRKGLALIWLAGILGWFFTFHWPRFALVLLPLEILLVFELLRRTTQPGRIAIILVVVAGLHGYFYTALTVTGSQVFRPAVQALVGGAPEMAFVPPSVKICQQVNQTLDPERHRLMFLGETRAYPCAIPFDFWNAHFRHPFERVEHDVDPAETWERHIGERGITHIVYSPEVARKRMEWSPEMHKRLERWLQERGKILARENDRESTTFLVELGATRLSVAD